MPLFPPPPAADPLHIFHPTGPIAPAFMRALLDTTLATQPLAADAAPDGRADHRLATMHAIATFQPDDALQAMLAGQMVAANARIMRCLALAAVPDADAAEARRHGAQAAALTRCMQATLRSFLRMQTARRKESEHPSERTGYWFRDVSVPAPESPPTSPGVTPAPDPAGVDVRATAPPVPGPRHHNRSPDPHNPMQSGVAPPAAAPGSPDDGASPRSAPPAAAPHEQHAMHSLPPGAGPGDEAPTPPHGYDPMQSGATRTPPQPTPVPQPAQARPACPADRGNLAASRPPGRQNPLPGEDDDPRGEFTTGDAIMRFASRRLHPDQSVEVAWAQAVAAAAAEEAEAACP